MSIDANILGKDGRGGGRRRRRKGGGRQATTESEDLGYDEVDLQRSGGGGGGGRGRGRGRGRNKRKQARLEAKTLKASKSKAGKSKSKSKKRKKPPITEIVELQPMAEPATLKRRHWGLGFGFVVMVLAPMAALVFYLWFISVDQYGSTTGFTVRQEESASATDLLGRLGDFAGGGNSAESDILYEFIQSQDIVEAIDQRMDLRAHYTVNWPHDWVFSLWPDATLEDLIWFWQRIVRISYDQSTGLIEVRTLAFDPDYAQQIAKEIVRESQDMINALNVQAREDAMGYALADLDAALDQLKGAREAMTQFRTRTQIVDPVADIQSRLGVMANLQQSLADALIEEALLRDSVSETDPRVANAQRRIEVIRAQIDKERENFATDNTETGALGEDYPTLIAEFESLAVDLEFAEQTYAAARTALDAAKANAARQSRYLATYIPPTLPRTSEYPQRYILSAIAALFLLFLWAVVALIYYSLRDRR